MKQTKYLAYLGHEQISADDCGPDPDDKPTQLRAEVSICVSMDPEAALQLARTLLEAALDDHPDVVQFDLPGFLEVDRDGKEYDYDPIGYREVTDSEQPDPGPLYPLSLTQVEPGLFAASVPSDGPAYSLERLLVMRADPDALLVDATIAGKTFMGGLPVPLSFFAEAAFGIRLQATLQPGQTVRMRAPGPGDSSTTMVQFLCRRVAPTAVVAVAGKCMGCDKPLPNDGRIFFCDDCSTRAKSEG